MKQEGAARRAGKSIGKLWRGIALPGFPSLKKLQLGSLRNTFFKYY
jgi:hypothetical protein